MPYPRRQSTGMQLHVEVAAPGEGSWPATVHALIGVNALAKCLAGWPVFVRYDPSDRTRGVLDSERNQSLPPRARPHRLECGGCWIMTS